MRDHKVREVLVVVAQHAEQVEAHVARWRKDNFTGRMKVKVVSCPGCTTQCDALRDIERKKLITEDFLLCSAEVLVDADLTPAIEAHRAGRKASKGNQIMTKVFTSGEGKSPMDCYTVLYHEQKQEILSYFSATSKPSIPGYVTKDLLKAGESFTMQMRRDAFDCHVDICAPEVLQVVTDSFDMESIREELVQLILDAKFNDEVSMQSVHLCELPAAGSAMVVRDPRSLYQASLKVAKTVTAHAKKAENPVMFPAVFVDSASCKPLGGGSVAGRDVVLADGVQPKSSMVGSGTSVGAATEIVRSIIGPNCKIAEECEIEDAWLGPNVTLLPGAAVAVGCIIGAGVTIGAGVAVPPFTRLTSTATEESAVGPDGVGSILRLDRPAVLTSVELMGSDVDKVRYACIVEHFRDLKKVEENADAPQEDDGLDPFSREVHDMIYSAKGDNSLEALLIELKSMRMGAHKSCLEMTKVVVPAVMNIVRDSRDQKLATVLAKWGELFSSFQTRDSMVEVLEAIRGIDTFCRAHPEEFGPSKFCVILQFLFKQDTFKAEAITAYYNELTSSVTKIEETAASSIKSIQTYSSAMEEFVQWLNESSDDGSDSDSDSD